MSEKSPQSYEKAFHRLEEILQKMNEPNLPLDESMKLFEEATQLVSFCEKKLSESEKKIDILLKSKSGEVQQDSSEKTPLMQPFEG